MLNYLKAQIPYLLKIAIAFTPWLISMYLLFWLGKHEIWVPETAHRDKITIAILVAGMALSFLLHSYFVRRQKNNK